MSECVFPVVANSTVRVLPSISLPASILLFLVSIGFCAQAANSSTLQGDWFTPSVGGCYFNKPVLTIKGDEILVRIRQMEGRVGTINSLKSDGADLLVGYEYSSPNRKESELK
jgi:hypothetical protein